MLTSITLQNFKSFGEEQTIPLSPITVLVGPNNSGKSNLVSLGRFIRNIGEGVTSAADREGGWDNLIHRPFTSPMTAHIAWKTTAGAYAGSIERNGGRVGWGKERLVNVRGADLLHWVNERVVHFRNIGQILLNSPLRAAQAVLEGADPENSEALAIFSPLVRSKVVKLMLPALLQDAAVVPSPTLGSDGSGVPTVLALWRGSDPERAEQLEDFVRRCLPEIKHVLVKPAPEAGKQRLWVQQTDGEMFDAAHLSDGVLCFIALAMHAIEAEPGSVLFVEEPEQGVHPRRLGMLVDLFRQIVAQRGCQVVVVTHSPILLDELRDEPEAILLFRRGEKGTVVKQLTELPTLMDALKDAQPGEMLANGFFDAPF